MNGKIILNRMRKNPFFMVGTITSIFILVVVLLTPVLAQYDPIKNSTCRKSFYRLNILHMVFRDMFLEQTKWDETYFQECCMVPELHLLLLLQRLQLLLQ